MLIETETSQRMSQAVATVEKEAQDRERKWRRDSQLQGKIRAMSREEKSVERSKNTGRIGNFNEKFVKSISELSIIRQTTPRVTAKGKEEATRIVEAII